MAERRTLARPYAQAVFEVARDSGRLQEWSAALNAAANVTADAAVAELLQHPGVTDEQLVGLIQDAVARSDGAASPLLAAGHGHNFLRLLAENERLGLLREIASLFDDLKDAAEDCVDVEVVSATELDEDARQSLTAFMQRRLGHRVRLSCKVDPELIGGVVIKAEDLVIDGSVKHRLDKLAHALIRP